MLFDDKTGAIRTDKRTGDELLRPVSLPPRCEQRGAKKCPRGHWSDPKGFDATTFAIHQAIKQCEMLGEFPPDPLLREFAKAIRLAEDYVKRHKTDADRQLQIDLAIFTASKGRQQ